HQGDCTICSGAITANHDFTGGQACPACHTLAGTVESPIGFGLVVDKYEAILGFQWKTVENTNLIGLTGKCLKADGTSCGN
ncbi:MAG: hypothetical protein RR450_08080, partial [Oscillospiraceae bacterium]